MLLVYRNNLAIILVLLYTSSASAITLKGLNSRRWSRSTENLSAHTGGISRGKEGSRVLKAKKGGGKNCKSGCVETLNGLNSKFAGANDPNNADDVFHINLCPHVVIEGTAAAELQYRIDPTKVSWDRLNLQCCGGSTCTIDGKGVNRNEAFLLLKPLDDNDNLDSDARLVHIEGILFQNFNGTGGAVLKSESAANTVLQVSRCTFQNNIAYGGAAIYANHAGSVVSSGNNYKGNRGSGGAMRIFSSIVQLKNDVFEGNYAASSNGGALYLLEGKIASSDSTFKKNSAGQDGGAMYISEGSLQLKDDTFVENSAESGDGGAIYKIYGYLEANQVTCSSNHATNGGAIFADVAAIVISKSTFSGNSALETGGAMAIIGSSTGLISKSDFSRNAADSAGGAIYNDDSSVVLSGNKFDNNEAAPGEPQQGQDYYSTSLGSNTFCGGKGSEKLESNIEAFLEDSAMCDLV